MNVFNKERAALIQLLSKWFIFLNDSKGTVFQCNSDGPCIIYKITDKTDRR